MVSCKNVISRTAPGIIAIVPARRLPHERLTGASRRRRVTTFCPRQPRRPTDDAAETLCPAACRPPRGNTGLGIWTGHDGRRWARHVHTTASRRCSCVYARENTPSFLGRHAICCTPARPIIVRTVRVHNVLLFRARSSRIRRADRNRRRVLHLVYNNKPIIFPTIYASNKGPPPAPPPSDR